MSVSECLRFCHCNHWAEDAIAAIRGANAKAQDWHCGYISTDYLLLALVADANRAATLLKKHSENAVSGIVAQIRQLLGSIHAPPVPPLRTRVARRIRRLLSIRDPTDDLPLTPRTANAVKTATELAATTLNWNDGHVGSEHILFAFLSDSDTVGYQVLANIGVTYDNLLTIARRLFGRE